MSALLSQVGSDIDIWEPQAESCLSEDGALWKLWDLLRQLAEEETAAAPAHVSLLRGIDVVAWMAGRDM